MARVLWINPAVGVSGDMLLGALIDVGADEGSVRKALETLDVPGWDLVVTEVERRGLRCRYAAVSAEVTEEPRTWSTIDALLAGADLPRRVEDGARATFLRLAEVEAVRHGVDLDDVHFHEVGAVDAIVDIVGCWAALDALGVREVRSGPVGLGVGTVVSSHGVLPHPAPAVMSLLEGSPVVGVEAVQETATPTGVALLVTMVDGGGVDGGGVDGGGVDAWGSCPAGTLIRSGIGAGSRDVATHPNVLSAMLIDTDDLPRVDAVLIETTVDDVTPEILGHVIDRALAAGADDAWLMPVVMKKSRPGHQLRVLCAPGLELEMIELVANETGTLGLRTYAVSKRVFSRTFDEVVVGGEMIRMKIGPYGAKPEADDVVRAAEATGRSARTVAAEAAAQWAAKQGE